MGGKSSKSSVSRHSSPSSWIPRYPQSPYVSHDQNFAPPHNYPSAPSYAPPPQNSAPQAGGPQRKLERKYSRIADNYSSLEQFLEDEFLKQVVQKYWGGFPKPSYQFLLLGTGCYYLINLSGVSWVSPLVTEALAHAGLESSNLIVGIDFTKSNEWTGARSFNRRSLHHIGDQQNPYEQALSIIGRTLSVFDEDNLIPCFGFGDASTHDQDVFSFYPDEKPCSGFEEALTRYREIVPRLRLAGPTSFSPIIEMATTIVDQSAGQYHVLLIIADGQVTRSVDTERGQLSPQEQKTVEAIVKASEYPLSIILVGVGDGPWDMMREFDDNIPSRAFDNFQFVNFTEIMSKNVPFSRKETEFALAALMEIPSQYKATLELNLLGNRNSKALERVSLPPPLYSAAAASFSSKPTHSGSFKQSGPPYRGPETSMGSFKQSAPPYRGPETSVGTASHASADFDNKVCPICLTDPKDMAFGCGHQTCCGCGQDLELCPICRTPIQTRIKLY